MTLTGPGGIGKTRLALQVAREIGEQFPGGVCFVALSTVSEAQSVCATIAQAVGAFDGGSQSAQASLKEYLGALHQPMLLLLDNFEHLVSEAPVIADLLSTAPKLKVVVTSQAPLHVYGEHESPVPPLELPELKSLPPVDALSRLPAVALFVERAQAVKREFALTKENAPAVAAICAHLDGLPLAIELAAARIKLLSPSAMLARLESCLNLLTGGARDLPTRQQTLRGTVDWSYGLLNTAEQTLFRRLSVFSGLHPRRRRSGMRHGGRPGARRARCHGLDGGQKPGAAGGPHRGRGALSSCCPQFARTRWNGLPPAARSQRLAGPTRRIAWCSPRKARRKSRRSGNGSTALMSSTTISGSRWIT